MDGLSDEVAKAMTQAAAHGRTAKTQSGLDSAGRGVGAERNGAGGAAGQAVSGSSPHASTRAGRRTPGANSRENESIAPPADEARTVEEQVAKEELELRSELSSRFGAVQRQMQSLMKLRAELKELENPSRRDVEIIRNRIERCERELVYASGRLKQTEEAFKHAQQEHAKKEKEKRMLVDHLRLILYENERKKQAKLAELRAKLQQLEGMQIAAAAADAGTAPVSGPAPGARQASATSSSGGGAQHGGGSGAAAEGRAGGAPETAR